MKRVLENVQSFAVIAVILSGIGGISYRMFRNGGWVEFLFGNIWDMSVEYPLIALPVIVGAVFLGKLWQDNRLARGHQSKLPDYVIYALGAAGVYFIGHFFVRGTF